MENWRHRRVKPPKGYPNADWSDAVYLKAAGKYILELEARLESEEAHYTRLVEQLAEERAKAWRLEMALRSVAVVYDRPKTVKSMVEAALQEGEQDG